MNERQTLHRLRHRQSKLLDCLYETVDTPGEWMRFLELLVDASHARSARLLFLNDRADHVESSYKINIDDSAHQQYVGHFVNSCPWRPELAQKTAGRLYSTHVHFSCSQRDFYRTEFFNDWARGLDIHHGICGTVYRETGLTVQLLVQRTRGQGHFSESETDGVNRLVPHLRRVVHLSRRLEAMQQESRAISRATGHSSLPFLLLSEHGAVNFVSEEAQRLIASTPALTLSRNRLHVAGLPADRNLRRRIAQMLPRSHGASQHSRPSDLRVPRPGMPDLHLIVTPLHPNMSALAMVPGTSRLAIFIHDPLLIPEVDTDLLMEMYGLTAAEARTAILVAQGQDVPEIARSIGTSPNTIRTQLKSAFRKTGTRRQAELACLLLTGPAYRRTSESGSAQQPGHLLAS